MGTKNWSVHEPANTLSRKNRKKLLNQVYKKTVFTEGVSSICKKEIWQTCRKTFAKRSKIFSWIPIVFTKINIAEETPFQKSFSEHIKGNFVNFEEKTSPKLKNYLAKIRKSSWKSLFPSEKPFSSGSYSAEVGSYFDNAAEKALRNFDFSLRVPKLSY